MKKNITQNHYRLIDQAMNSTKQKVIQIMKNAEISKSIRDCAEIRREVGFLADELIKIFDSIEFRADN